MLHGDARVGFDLNAHSRRGRAAPVDGVIDLGHLAGVHNHVHGKDACVLVHHRRSEVEEEEGGRLGVRGDHTLQHAHHGLCIAAGVARHHVHLHTHPVYTEGVF